MRDVQFLKARTWAEINLDHIHFNYHNALAELSPNVAHYTVLKANAYGLGAAPIARFLYGEGARRFAVACVSEGLELKAALPDDAEVLVMGDTLPGEEEASILGGITSTVPSYHTACLLSKAAEKLGVAVPIHIKVDTGLHRLGFAFEEGAEEILKVLKLPGLAFQGLFSHLQRRSADHDRLQAMRLAKVWDDLALAGVKVPMLHLLDSIGMWRYPSYQFDAVRDAAFILGHTQPDYPRPKNIRFALTLKTRILRIHEAQPGDCLGYDSEHPLQKPTRVATLAIGYADGYPRAMSQVGQVAIHGRRAEVLGVVCMDLTMVDVTDIPQAQVGDEVIVLGGSISIWEYAGFMGGYNNECIAMISRRVPRVYLRSGEIIDQWEGM